MRCTTDHALRTLPGPHGAALSTPDERRAARLGRAAFGAADCWVGCDGYLHGCAGDRGGRGRATGLGRHGGYAGRGRAKVAEQSLMTEIDKIEVEVERLHAARELEGE